MGDGCRSRLNRRGRTRLFIQLNLRRTKRIQYRNQKGHVSHNDSILHTLCRTYSRQSLAKLGPLIQLLPYVHRIGTPAFRQWFMDILPSRTIQRLQRAVKLQNKQAEEIIRVRQELISTGGDLSSEAGRGKDIMTLLSGVPLLVAGLVLTPATK
jgi:hypothetical protein